jgi:glucose-6-phosphate-specific signal transduction histidine kinase
MGGQQCSSSMLLLLLLPLLPLLPAMLAHKHGRRITKMQLLLPPAHSLGY